MNIEKMLTSHMEDHSNSCNNFDLYYSKVTEISFNHYIGVVAYTTKNRNSGYYEVWECTDYSGIDMVGTFKFANVHSEQLYYDFEEEKIYTREEMRSLFDELKNDNETEIENFGQWLNEVCSKNGTVEKIS